MAPCRCTCVCRSCVASRTRSRSQFQVVNLDRLSALFPEGGDVTVADLVAKGAVRSGHPVKVLGTGEITVKVNITADKFSADGQGEDRGRRRLGHLGLRPVQPESTGGNPCGPVRHDEATSAPGAGPTRPGCPGLLAGAVESPATGRGIVPGLPTPHQPHRGIPHHPGGPVLTAFTRAFKTPDLRRKLLFTLGIIVIFRLGSLVPGPGRELHRRAAVHQGRADDHRCPRPGQPVQRRRAAAAVDLRARDHAVHHGEHHRAAADRGHPAVRGPQEGGPAGPDEDDPVHPLPDHRPRGAAVLDADHLRARTRRACSAPPARASCPTTRSRPWSSWSSP